MFKLLACLPSSVIGCGREEILIINKKKNTEMDKQLQNGCQRQLTHTQHVYFLRCKAALLEIIPDLIYTNVQDFQGFVCKAHH